ncbi:MAG: hypothetical protein NC452_05775 [Eubacterium sp.]|nr:hypothetical protein [Eubacterium sp.]
MTLKRFLLTFLSMTLMVSVLSITVSAESRKQDTVQPTYAIAQNPKSTLNCVGTEASCYSNAKGTNATSITATQTLQVQQGNAWTTVKGASWTSTVSSSNISLQNTKSGLANGTYRLKSVFTLTNKDGKTETVTVYSEEKTVS